MDIGGYLARLGLDRPPAPTLDWLVDAHRAHVERIPYATLDIHLGRPGPLDPAVCVDRIVRTGRTGYCFQLNGAFGALLSALGYDVRRHRGLVWAAAPAWPEFPHANHLALTVHGLPGGAWFVDAGLGDALHEPLELVAGDADQGPFRYRLERLEGGWRFHHDPAGSFTAMDFADALAGPGAFDDDHAHMSTSPESNFVADVTVSRRDATGVDKLINRTVRRVDGAGTVDWEITSDTELFAALADIFGLGLDDLDADDRAVLWRDAQAGQDAYLRSRDVAG